MYNLNISSICSGILRNLLNKHSRSLSVLFKFTIRCCPLSCHLTSLTTVCLLLSLPAAKLKRLSMQKSELMTFRLAKLFTMAHTVADTCGGCLNAGHGNLSPRTHIIVNTQRTHRHKNSPHVSVQHGAGVERGESATVGGLLGGVQLE